VDLGSPADCIRHEAVSKVDEGSRTSVPNAEESVVYVHGATLFLDQFDEKTVTKFVDRYGQVDKVRVDNSSKMQHPLHLSNVNDPLAYVRNLAKLLKPDGTVAIRTPYLGAIVREGFLDYVYHEHQSYFSLMSIRNLFLKLGFNIVNAYMCENDNLNAEFVFTKASPAVRDRPTLKQFSSMEDSLDLDKPLTYIRLGTHLKLLQEKVQQKLESIKTTTIAGYGASVAPVSMMYQYNIVNFLDFLVDDNNEKIDLFCPAANLRVRSSDSLYVNNVDVLVVLASRFSNEIIQRHPQFTGKVLIPTLGWSCSR
jgi:hypothetical protein